MSRELATPPLPLATLHALWRELVDLPFPTGVATEHRTGLDLPALDHAAGELIERFLTAQGRLAATDMIALARVRRDLATAARTLTGEAAEYFTRLERLAGNVLAARSALSPIGPMHVGTLAPPADASERRTASSSDRPPSMHLAGPPDDPPERHAGA